MRGGVLSDASSVISTMHDSPAARGCAIEEVRPGGGVLTAFLVDNDSYQIPAGFQIFAIPTPAIHVSSCPFLQGLRNEGFPVVVLPLLGLTRLHGLEASRNRSSCRLSCCRRGLRLFGWSVWHCCKSCGWFAGVGTSSRGL